MAKRESIKRLKEFLYAHALKKPLPQFVALCFDYSARSQPIDSNKKNNKNRCETFEEFHNLIRKSEHRNNHERKKERQQDLQSLSVSQNQNRRVLTALLADHNSLGPAKPCAIAPMSR